MMKLAAAMVATWLVYRLFRWAFEASPDDPGDYVASALAA